MILDSYEDKMLMAFVQKKKKFEWYKKIFYVYDNKGKSGTFSCMSFWATIAGPFYLFYRKAYLYGVIYCILIFAISSSEILDKISFDIYPLIYMLNGIILPHLIYQKYKKSKEKIEKKIKEEDRRIKAMQKLGGVSNIMLIIGIIFNVLLPLLIIAAKINKL